MFRVSKPTSSTLRPGAKRISVAKVPVLSLTQPRPLHSKQPSLTDRSPKKSSIHQLSSSDSQESLIKKPISLAILEKYFTDVSISISQKSQIDHLLISKAETMTQVLKDCLTAIHNLSLDIYILMSSSLKDIQSLQSSSSEEKALNLILSKILKITAMIEDNKYRSQTEIIHRREEFSTVYPTEEEEGDVGKELAVRASRVTARILNIWKKIVCNQREAGIICSCFLLLYCEVDKSIKVSPFGKILCDRAVNLMREYCANPGHAVTIIRKTKEYIDREMINGEVIKKISLSLKKINAEDVRNIDRTLTGFTIYELLVYAVRYYEKSSMNRCGVNEFDMKIDNECVENEAKLEREALRFSSTSPVRNTKANDSATRKAKGGMVRTQSALSLKSKTNIKPAPSPLKKPFQKLLKKSKLSQLKPGKKSTGVKSSQKTSKRSIQSSCSPSPLRSSGHLRTSSNIIEHKDLLEEMQYQQFIEGKFRLFLVEKLKQSMLDQSSTGSLKESEEDAINNRELWMKEFEKKVDAIRFNAIQRLGDESRFISELTRAKNVDLTNSNKTNY